MQEHAEPAVACCESLLRGVENMAYPVNCLTNNTDSVEMRSITMRDDSVSRLCTEVRGATWLRCCIVLGAVLLQACGQGSESADSMADSVTYAEHVAPILYANCVECHRPGEVAPFSLLTYEDTRIRGPLMVYMTGEGLMPPWKAGPGDYAFKNERHITPEQIATLARWVEIGMPEGDPSLLPPTPTFTEGWQLGPPDLVATMPESFPVPADGPDVYRNFVVSLDLDEDVWVRAVDFRPSARSVVHHSLFFLDNTGSAREQDGKDGLPGYSSGMGVRVGGFSSRGEAAREGNTQTDAGIANSRRAGGLGGWAIGGRARELPEGLAYLVPKGADLILSTHFRPSGEPASETSSLGLYFADGPPKQAFTYIQLPSVFGVFEGIDIPAGESDYSIADTFVLPVDIKAFNVGAHAHYLGKEIKLTATLPGGEARTLLWIEEWDFAWQELYQFADYVELPAGTQLEVHFSYDNSAENLKNPSSPPIRVTWGEQSTDEMASVTLQVVTANPDDLPQLEQAYREHVRRAFFAAGGLRWLQQFRSAMEQ